MQPLVIHTLRPLLKDAIRSALRIAAEEDRAVSVREHRTEFVFGVCWPQYMADGAIQATWADAPDPADAPPF